MELNASPKRSIALAIGPLVLAFLCGSAPSPALSKDILGTEKKLYSQIDEEVIIRDFFQDRRNGFFVDIGCAWPIQDSTTYYLEKHLGWSGIAVDARAELAPEWKVRPKSKFLNYIVTDHSGTIDAFYVAGGLSSTQQDRDFLGKPVHGQETHVPSITLTKLLEKTRVSKIDFLSMDIEDGEPRALAGFDIDRFKPKLVCIEIGGNGDKIRAYFTAHRYERIDKYLKRDTANWYFKPK